jgi:plastocyanin
MVSMKGARALAGGMLVLASVCTIPAVSAAQDVTVPELPTTTTSDPLPLPVESAPPETPPAPPPQPAISEATPADAPAAASSASSAPKAQKSASASVSIGDNFYAPPSVTVAVGDRVTWNNNGQATHSATADDGSFDTGVFGPGGSRLVTFDSPGTFSYYCTVHGQSQSGTVRVLAASGGGGGGGGGAGGSSTSATSDSEAAAVASPEAAGDANTLPATGLAAGGLALVGAALIASGLVTRIAGRRRSIS